MSFISYAQNFEDLMLWRALRHVGQGTYVDVGAQDPVIDSVSRAFHERGWHGVHIEPVPLYAARLRAERPGDIVLQAALGAENGTLALNVIADTGLTTAVDTTAARHAQAGFATERVQVPALTLTSALGMLAGRAVHWLKIDVEGFEEQVLRGWDSSLLRPWVMVIEATVPGSADLDYAGWEPLVVKAGYRFVYFDGLNRFYVADEHPELVSAFGLPPNVFDDVQLSGTGSWGLCRQLEQAHQAALALAAAQAASAQAALRSQCAALATERDASAALEQAARAGSTALRLRCEALEQEAIALRASVQDAHALRDTLCEALRDTLRDALATRVAELENELAQQRHDALAAARRLAEAQAQTHEWWSLAHRLSGEVQAFHASTSWRITAPLRRLARLLSRLSGGPERKRGPQAGSGSGAASATPAPTPAPAPPAAVAPALAALPATPAGLARRAALLYGHLKKNQPSENH